MNIYYTFKNFKENYSSELTNFLKAYEDNDEVDFCNEQIRLYNHCLENVIVFLPEASNKHYTKPQLTGENLIDEILNKIRTRYVGGKLVDHESKHIEKEAEVFHFDFELAENLGKSFSKIITFLEDKKLESGTSIDTSIINTIDWQGSTLDFSEFTKALIESGYIGKVKNEAIVFEKMKRFFNVKDFDKSDKLKQVRNRTKELTPVINTLETSLLNWIKRKD
ncbi:hypothetical protein [Flavobacterium sp. N2038]|uniref:hypothetical protein n=1 Tax=Flavobacterium sp. N2038 TaxID=2986829 RepID=UPI002224FAFB|nr:hypothetical protein [Flavobacterium sp. N2038]